MRLCIFSGTFNPIHNGHIYMAEHIIKTFQVEKLLFIPAFVPPQKENNPKLTKHRYEMVKLATELNPHFEVSDIEFRLGGKSYSYLTVLELYKEFDLDEKINFVIGTDAFKNLDTWYESEKLRKIVKFIVFARENEFKQESYEYMKEKGYDFDFAQMQFNDISSTDIRERIKNGKTITDLVPANVERYIIENDLYKN